jgi:hypothetical protein
VAYPDTTLHKIISYGGDHHDARGIEQELQALDPQAAQPAFLVVADSSEFTPFPLASGTFTAESHNRQHSATQPN